MNDDIKKILDKIKRWCDLALDDKCNTIMYKYELVAILDCINNLQQEKDDYKSRNEKAIEYIKSNSYIETTNEYLNYGDDLSPKHLVDILQGSDKE